MTQQDAWMTGKDRDEAALRPVRLGLTRFPRRQTCRVHSERSGKTGLIQSKHTAEGSDIFWAGATRTQPVQLVATQGAREVESGFIAHAEDSKKAKIAIIPAGSSALPW